jgi:hypothetical protein
MSSLHNSEYYRKRAASLRQAADEAQSRDNRDTLLSFAADFDALAGEAERAEAAEPKPEIVH